MIETYVYFNIISQRTSLVNATTSATGRIVCMACHLISDKATAVFNRIIWLDDTLHDLCQFLNHFHFNAATDTKSLAVIVWVLYTVRK